MPGCGCLGSGTPAATTSAYPPADRGLRNRPAPTRHEGGGAGPPRQQPLRSFRPTSRPHPVGSTAGRRPCSRSALSLASRSPRPVALDLPPALVERSRGASSPGRATAAASSVRAGFQRSVGTAMPPPGVGAGRQPLRDDGCYRRSLAFIATRAGFHGAADGLGLAGRVPGECGLSRGRRSPARVASRAV